MSDPDLTDLTETEKDQLKQVMKKAKEFMIEEEKNLLRQRLEGQLLKFTNVVKGYQYRWFVINPDSGTLEYFEKEDHKRLQRPRGCLSLTYAVICPSDEDSQTFVVNAANGEIFKLKAADAKERQHWVNRLRAVSEYQTDHVASAAALSHSDSRTSLISRSSCDRPLQQQQGPTSMPSTSLPATGGTLGRRSNKPLGLVGSLAVSLGGSSASSLDQNSVGVQGSTSTDLASDNDSATGRGGGVLFHCGLSGMDPFRRVIHLLHQLDSEVVALGYDIDRLPRFSSETITSFDRNILLAKATSQASVTCLKRCMDSIRQLSAASVQQQYNSGQGAFGGPTAAHEWNNGTSAATGAGTGGTIAGDLTSASAGMGKAADSDGSRHRRCSLPGRDSSTPTGSPSASVLSGLPLPISGMDTGPVPVNHAEEVEDAEGCSAEQEEELGSVEEHKSVILHMISQLKLGMDLTKVVLPTFILEKRSLLEMFADYMTHPSLFLRITEQTDPENRMLALLEWYLTAFHAGRKGAIAKKPYNPIIGETFHCSWRVPVGGGGSPSPLPQPAAPASENTAPPVTSTGLGPAPLQQVLLTFCAEQVSHHPPVTAFYFECPDRRMTMTGSIYTKSKFQGMTISATMIGKVVLRLGEHDDEEYSFTLPSAHARSILSLPWVELGDRINIHCSKTGYTANVIFHTKPFYGGKLHKISAEVKNPESVVFCRAHGEWNGVIEFEHVVKAERRAVDVTRLPIHRKRVRPMSSQRAHESRRLWFHVTGALRRGDMTCATERKRELEDRQRVSEKYRLEHRLPFPVKYFVRSAPQAATTNSNSGITPATAASNPTTPVPPATSNAAAPTITTTAGSGSDPPLWSYYRSLLPTVTPASGADRAG